MQRRRVPFVDRDVLRAQSVDQARDEREDLFLTFPRDICRKLWSQELPMGRFGTQISMLRITRYKSQTESDAP